MASVFLKYYADVEKATDAAVKKEYGVVKADVLKVLEKLLVEDLAGNKTAASAKAPAKRGRKPGKRGRKPGRKPAVAKVPAKRGRKPMAAKLAAPKIEVS